MSNLGKIDKVNNITAEEFYRDYANLSKPVIIQGAIEEWPAMQKWNLEYLKEKIGKVNVSFKECPSFLHPDFSKPTEIKINTTPFSEYADTLINSEVEERARYFLTGDAMCFQYHGKINEDFLPIMQDIGDLPYFKAEEVYQEGLWITASGVRSWLHYDRGYNLNAQVTGKKVVRLFNPEEAKKLYLFRNSKTQQYNFSQINIVNPELNKFPFYDEANYFEDELNEGDLLFIPEYWLHDFSHVGEININVNFWWDSKIRLLNPLSARESFLKAFWNSQGLENNPPTKEIKEFIVKNPNLAVILEKIEDSFFI